jgi:ATP-dependent protease ClpP protease subunit
MKQKITLSLPKHIENAVKDENFRVFYNDSAEELEIFLYGVVGDEFTESDAGSINKILSRDKKRPATLRINSFGGLAYDGLAIHNAIADHQGPTTAIIESVAASAASLAAIGADRVKMYANATYQIHQGIGFAYGHIAEIKETLDWLEMFNAAAVTTYAVKTGKSEDVIAAALLGVNGDGTKYNAQQALEFGFVDEIVTAGAGKKTKSSNDTKLLQSMLNYRIANSVLTKQR